MRETAAAVDVVDIARTRRSRAGGLIKSGSGGCRSENRTSGCASAYTVISSRTCLLETLLRDWFSCLRTGVAWNKPTTDTTVPLLPSRCSSAMWLPSVTLRTEPSGAQCSSVALGSSCVRVAIVICDTG